MNRFRHILYLVCCSCISSHVIASEFFDAHLHYNAEHAEHYSAEDIKEILKQSGVTQAAVTSRPPSLVQKLYDADPQRIVPLLGIYRTTSDKQTWIRDKQLPERIRKQLNTATWAGIGELHLFASDRHSEVFLQILELANNKDLPLMLHTDPAVIDTVYETAPESKVLWAHAGTYPYPDLISDYLDRYPNLMIDLSVREQRILRFGEIDDAWYQLIIDHPDRIVMGVDTFSTDRWQHYSKAKTAIDDILERLPATIATRLASENGERLFKRR